MKNNKLSKRLHKASEYVVSDQPILDVGSDHAYLPIYLLRKKRIPFAIAGEITKGPFQHAKKTITQYGLDEKISVRLGDGLDVINEKDNIGTIFVCGMGGALIADILNIGKKNKKLPRNVRLVLQPNNTEPNLREWLADNNYKIENETILEENDRIYEIIIAEYTLDTLTYTEEEIRFGPILMRTRSDAFIKKWNRKIIKNKEILSKINHAENKEKVIEIENKNKKLKKVIS